MSRSHRMLRNLSSLGFVALAGCPSSEVAAKPVEVPQQLPGVHVADCVTFTPFVPGGSAAPQNAKNVVAHCSDAKICSAAFERGEVVVWAKAPGQTDVVVAYDHPTTGAHEEKRIPVTAVVAQPEAADSLHPRVATSNTCMHDHPTPAP